MIGFTRPLVLLLVALAPLYGLLTRSGIIRRMSFSLTLGDWNGIPFRWSSGAYRLVNFLSVFCITVAWIFAVMAAAGPVRYRQEPVYSGQGTAILFALDVSPSMAAKDMGGETRLDSARAFIRSFVEKRPGDSFALTAIGSDAALLVPPTRDHRSFLARLDSLSIGELGDGTALGLGIAVGAAHLSEQSHSKSAIVLLTDGENNAGEIHPHTAAGLLADLKIAFFVIGLGTRGEVPVEYTDPSTGRVFSGMLDSNYDEAALEKIAQEGGGLYAHAATPDALSGVFSGIGETVPVRSTAWSRTVEDPLEQSVLLWCIGFVAFAWFFRRLFMGALL